MLNAMSVWPQPRYAILLIYIDAMKQSQVFVADMSSVEAGPHQVSEPIEKKDF